MSKELLRIQTKKGYAYVNLVPAFGLAFGMDKNSSQNDYVLILLCFSFEWKGIKNKRKTIEGVTEYKANNEL